MLEQTHRRTAREHADVAGQRHLQARSERVHPTIRPGRDWPETEEICGVVAGHAGGTGRLVAQVATCSVRDKQLMVELPLRC